MTRRSLPLFFALCMAGCVGWLWSRGSTAAGPASSPGAIPEAPAERRKAALFYSDLGPDTVDVSAYPQAQRRNYTVYVRVCSFCHTLARSVNAPFVSRGWWDFYITNMRMRARRLDIPMTDHDVRDTLDFLEYDSNERKVGRAKDFDATRAELKRRFELVLDERVDALRRQPLP